MKLAARSAIQCRIRDRRRSTTPPWPPRGYPGPMKPDESTPPGVRAAFDEIRAGALSGFNVTMPHKVSGCRAVRSARRRRRHGRFCQHCDADRRCRLGLLDRHRGYPGRLGGLADRPVLSWFWGRGAAAAATCVALADRHLYLAARRFGAGVELAVTCWRPAA